MSQRNDPFQFLVNTVPQISKNVALKVARVPGVHILVRDELCTGCTTCVRKRFCLINAISVVDRKAKINDRLCRGCGRCTHLCPKKALVMELRPPAFVDSAVKQMDPIVQKFMR